MLSERIVTLQQKILGKYDLEQLNLRVGEEDFCLRVVRDVDQLLDELISKGEDHEDVRDERIPYWADLWHSAIGLADYILKDSGIGPQTEVLELGCGLGLPGIAAGRKGAKVILTDYLTEALELAELLWLENINQAADCRLVDWRKIDPNLNPNYVLAADVVYEQRNFEPLLEAFRHFIAKGAVVLLSEPGRKFSEGFIELLLNQNFQVVRHTQSISNRELAHQVSVYRISN